MCLFQTVLKRLCTLLLPLPEACLPKGAGPEELAGRCEATGKRPTESRPAINETSSESRHAQMTDHPAKLMVIVLIH